jgi:S1-C subfamily serine protease
MNRILACLTLILAFAVAPYAASPWTPVHLKLRNAVVFIEAFDEHGVGRTGSCTGWSINTVKHYFLTASHCDAPMILADGTTAVKVFKDERHDLLVLRVEELDLPALKLAVRDPDPGDEVASMGYGFGLVDPMFRLAHISNVDLQIEELASQYIMIDAAFIGGQSGGPLANVAGEVIAIIQRGGNGLGIGVGADVIKKRAGKYFSQD